MATMVTRKNGTREIVVVVGDKRPVIRLGKCSKKAADDAKSYIEELAGFRRTGASLAKLRPEVVNWVIKVEPVVRKRLIRAGLVGESAGTEKVPTLREWLDWYIDFRKDLKPGTLCNLHQSRRLLLERFPADKMLDALTHADVEDFALWLRTERGLAEGTVRRQLRRCRQIFAAAGKRGKLDTNPFDGIRCGDYSTTDRYYFVTREEAQAVLDACPDAQWRLIFALARFGGLRIPSEMIGLKWNDVNWERNRFLVHSPKTEHLDGKGVRVVPIFPELMPYLREAFEAAEPGQEKIITRYGPRNSNLRTQLLRIINKAGVKPWKKPFQNCRSTRETELVREHPIHVVTSWLGNSPDVAHKHYLQVTNADFEKAVQGKSKNATQSATQAQQNTQQHPPENQCKESRETRSDTHKPNEIESLRTFSQSVGRSRNSKHSTIGYPARTRTWNIRTKT